MLHTQPVWLDPASTPFPLTLTATHVRATGQPAPSAYSEMSALGEAPPAPFVYWTLGSVLSAADVDALGAGFDLWLCGTLLLCVALCVVLSRVIRKAECSHAASEYVDTHSRTIWATRVIVYTGASAALCGSVYARWTYLAGRGSDEVRPPRVRVRSLSLERARPRALCAPCAARLLRVARAPSASNPRAGHALRVAHRAARASGAACSRRPLTAPGACRPARSRSTTCSSCSASP